MSEELQIGDLVEVDNEEHYVKYPLGKGIFINEMNESKLFTEQSTIKVKNEDWRDFSEFSEDEKKLLVMFSGGAMKKDIDSKFLDEIIAEFTFKKLVKEKYLMRLFPNKDKYVSKIEDRKVLKLL